MLFLPNAVQVVRSYLSGSCCHAKVAPGMGKGLEMGNNREWAGRNQIDIHNPQIIIMTFPVDSFL